MARKRGRRGEGGITRRPNGRWQAQHSTTEGGIRHRVTRTFDLKADAEWWLREARRGNVPDDPLLSGYLVSWLAGKRRIRESTRALYESHVRVHLVPALGGYRLSELRPRHVERFVADLRLSAGTVGLVLRTLRSALQHAARTGLIPDNAAQHVEAPIVRREPVEAMTEDQAFALLEAVRGSWLEYVVRFLMGTGCRVGEACALDQGDVFDGYVLIRRPKVNPRATLVSEDGMAALREAIRLAPRRGPKEPVFFGERGDRLRREAVTHGLPRVLLRAGLPRLTPHKLRHGVATLMLSGGANMRVVADQLGHANPAVTARVYAHVVPAVARQAIGVLDQAARKR